MRLTRRMIAQSRVIAKGNRIRAIRRLLEQYGGRASKWVKKSGPRFKVADEEYEYHWYEHPSIGPVELRRRRVERP